MAHVTIPSRSASIPVPSPLPGSIRRVLGRLDRRLRAAAGLKGLGTVALIVALGAAAGMAADFAWMLPQSVRWALWGIWAAAGGAGMIAMIVRLLARRRDSLDLAAVAERGRPDLGERLTGAVGLLAGPGTPHGSPALIAIVADEAAARASTINPARAVSLGRGARRLALGILVVALVAAPGAIWPGPYGTLARRFLSPWADLERVGRFVVTVSPGDRVAPIGSDLTISARVRARFGTLAPPDDAWLEWTDAAGASHRVAMPPETPAPSASTPNPAERAFAVTLPSLSGSIAYRVVSGQAASRRHRITAVEPPAVAMLSARVEPPAYTRMPASTARDPGRIEAWEGSRVTLTVSTRAPVRSIDVEWPRSVPSESSDDEKTVRVAASMATDGMRGTAALVAEESGTYALAIRDGYGLTNRPEPPRRVIVRLDAPPVVAIQGADAPREARRDDVLNVAVAARDDVAVASVEVHYAIHRGVVATDAEGADPETGHVAAPLDGLGTRTARGLAGLELGPMKLKSGDVLSYRVRVADNRPAPRGPNVVWSEPRELTIVADAESLQARQGRAAREALQAKLDAIKKSAAENRKETEQLRYAADAAQRGNGGWDKERQEALEHREAEARNVGDRLQLLSRELADDARFRPLSRPARQVAEVEAEAGREMLDQARREADPARRLADLRQADSRLNAVTTKLDELQRQFDAIAHREADLGKLGELAAREEAIAARAAADADQPADRALLDRLQAEQEAARKDLEALLKKSPELRADVLAAQAAEADAIAKRAHDLAARQRDEAKKTADLSKRSAELKAVAEAQRALEEDVRRLALDVDDPLAQNGRSRVNTDQVRQAADPIERGDLDQARHHLEGAEGELRRLARDLEDVPDDPRAQAMRLARRQEALNEQVRELTNEVDPGKDAPPDVKAAIAARLKPLADRQKAISRLAGEIKIPDGPRAHEGRDAAEHAKREAADAASHLAESKPRSEIDRHQNRARETLNRLASVIPDVWQRREPSRHKLEEIRREAYGVAQDLERHLRETAPRADRLPDPAHAAEDLANRLAPLADRQAKVAEALGKLQVDPRVEPQRDRAAHRAEALAEALKAARDKSTPREARQEVRDHLPAIQTAARASLDRLEHKFHDRVPADDVAAELAADEDALKDAMARPDAAPRAAQAADQRRIATALRNLDVPDAADARAEAIRLAQKAADALGDPQADPAAAVREAAEAADALADKLADRKPDGPAEAPAQNPAPADPEVGISPRQTADARELARRERQIRERLQAVVGDGIVPQEALKREAVDLGREAADLRERSRPLSDRSHGPSHEAARLLGEEAPRVMQQGADHLTQAQPSQARDDQRRAAESVERGAQQAEDLAAALRADVAAAIPAPAEAAPLPGPLAEAREAMREAGQDLNQARDPSHGQAATQAAAEAMRTAARDLRAAVRHAAEAQLGQKGTPSPSRMAEAGEPAPGDPQGPNLEPDAMADEGVADLSELQEMIRRKTGRAWGDLPGHLRTEILQMSQGRYRDDYSRLIQLYFREIAAGSDRPAPEPRR